MIFGKHLAGRTRSGLAWAVALWGGASLWVCAQSVSDYAVRCSATVATNPPTLTLSWPADPKATNYAVRRKTRDAVVWATTNVLGPGATNYVDTNVVLGGAYEYRITKSATNYSGEGTIYAGLEVPLVEFRGKVILLVDSTQATPLALELARLEQDLVGDGWTVLRHDVARTAAVTNVKALIVGDYNADPTHVKALFLFGHLPVPYAGIMDPDGHLDHLGAWPADAYYGEMNSPWTDSLVTTTSGSDPRNRNVPGDGKFDQTTLPSDVELQVGRVDLANLPAFPQSETELLRQYLNKDHNFRHRLISAEPRGLIADNLGVYGGEAFAVNGWRNFAPFFGATNSVAGNWFGTLSGQSYLWGYAGGGGTPTSAAGIGSTGDYATNDPRVVFTMSFGSYFGDWDTQNNFLRAPLGSATYTLTCAWAGRPYWYFHHMALGETVGFSARVTQNNQRLYSGNAYTHSVHIALMGDPTLRMHSVTPPAALALQPNPTGGVTLSWRASSEAVAGYHVYAATTTAEPFRRLNAELLLATNYTDPVVSAKVYMVRAVKLEETPSGSYANASQGVFLSFDGLVPPMLTITAQDATAVFGAPLPAFTALYDGWTNGDSPANLTSPPLFSTPATQGSPVGDYPIYVSGASDSNYLVRFIPGTLRILPAATAGQVTSSANPSAPGQPLLFTVALQALAPGQGVPSGLVRWVIDGTNVGEPLVLTGGQSAFSPPALAHGLHRVVAEYAGDGSFTGSTNLLTAGQLVNTLPVAGADSVFCHPALTVKVAIASLLANDSDADGDPLTFVGCNASSANGGMVTLEGGWLFYTPPPGVTQSDRLTYTISDGYGTPVVGTVTIVISNEGASSLNLAVVALGNGSFWLVGDGLPGCTYRIQFNTDLATPNWQPLGTATANLFGTFALTDTPGAPRRFYRAVWP